MSNTLSKMEVNLGEFTTMKEVDNMIEQFIEKIDTLGAERINLFQVQSSLLQLYVYRGRFVDFCNLIEKVLSDYRKYPSSEENIESLFCLLIRINASKRENQISSALELYRAQFYYDKGSYADSFLVIDKLHGLFAQPKRHYNEASYKCYVLYYSLLLMLSYGKNLDKPNEFDKELIKYTQSIGLGQNKTAYPLLDCLLNLGSGVFALNHKMYAESYLLMKKVFSFPLITEEFRKFYSTHMVLLVMVNDDTISQDIQSNIIPLDFIMNLYSLYLDKDIHNFVISMQNCNPNLSIIHQNILKQVSENMKLSFNINRIKSIISIEPTNIKTISEKLSIPKSEIQTMIYKKILPARIHYESEEMEIVYSA